jgi:hypothetical protein
MHIFEDYQGFSGQRVLDTNEIGALSVLLFMAVLAGYKIVLMMTRIAPLNIRLG